MSFFGYPGSFEPTIMKMLKLYVPKTLAKAIDDPEILDLVMFRPETTFVRKKMRSAPHTKMA